MYAKEYLSRIKLLDYRIRNKKIELEDIEYKMQGISSVKIGDKNGINSSSNIQSPQEKLIFKYFEYQKDLSKSIEELMNLKTEAMARIDKLDNADYVNLLYKRYFQYKKWEEIALEMNYAYRSIIRLHDKALHKMDKIIGSNCG